MMDWKEALAGMKGEFKDSGEDKTEEIQKSVIKEKKNNGKKLNVVVERKGRHGKTATIIEGFELSDAELQAVASKLKQKLGTGGSARGGEILIQGERRDEVITLLKSMEFRV